MGIPKISGGKMSTLYAHRAKVALVIKFLPFIVGVCLYGFLAFADGKLFPVIKDFTITRIYNIGNDNEKFIGGYFSKIRSCPFITIHATGTDAQGKVSKVHISHTFEGKNYYDTNNKPKGTFEWGDWKLITTPDIVDITLYGLHECSSLWITETELIHFKLYPGIQNIWAGNS